MLWSLGIGLVAGWLAGMISQGSGLGLWGDLVTGVVGSFIGSFLFNMMGIAVYGLWGTLLASTLGAVLLLWILRMVFHVAPAAAKKKE
ncbi:MAG: GlsB/YeaQ/YmgE family stress response membrane protein [Sporomusaceae bacterium]|nr:GlsB/YeaQ/YmgE family stress response membrane protein [Sporomusaceae bacterium]